MHSEVINRHTRKQREKRVYDCLGVISIANGNETLWVMKCFKRNCDECFTTLKYTRTHV